MSDLIPEKRTINISTYLTNGAVDVTSSLSSTKTIYCNYSGSKPDKLVDSQSDALVDNIFLNNGIANVVALKSYKSSMSFTVGYNILDVMTGIPEAMFASCPTLQSVGNIPSGYTKIGKNAFRGDTSLRKVDLPQSITSIAENAFDGCYMLYSLDVPNVVSLYDYSFAGCGIKKISLNPLVYELPPYTFKDCINLKSFVDTNIIGLGVGAFENCISLERVEVGVLGREAQSVKSSTDTMIDDPTVEPDAPPVVDPENPDLPPLITNRRLYNRSGWVIGEISEQEVDDIIENGYGIEVSIEDGVQKIQLKQDPTFHVFYIDPNDGEKFSTTDFEYLSNENSDENNGGALMYGQLSYDYASAGSNVGITWQKNQDDSTDWTNAKVQMRCYEVYTDQSLSVKAYNIWPAALTLRLANNDSDDHFSQLDGNLSVFIDENFDSVRYDTTGESPVYTHNYIKFGYDITDNTTGETNTVKYVNAVEAVEVYHTSWKAVSLYLSNSIELMKYLYDNDFDYSLTTDSLVAGAPSREHFEDSDADGDTKSEPTRGGITYGAGNGIVYGKIPNYLFSGCIKLSPSNIKFNGNALADNWGDISDVGIASFMGCLALDDLSGTSSLQKVGKYSFKDCLNLGSIDLSNCTSIGSYAFKACKSLESIDLSSVERMDNVVGVFEDCSSLASVENAEIQDIPEKMFKNCSSLAEYPLSTVKRVYSQGFMGCSSLVTDGGNDLSTIQYIESYAFANCYSLDNITLNPSLSVGQGAFMNCTSLSSVTLPESITSLPSKLFAGCTSLEEIEFTAQHSNADFNLSALDGCYGLKRIIMPEAEQGQSPRYKTVNGQCIIDTVTKKLIYVAKNVSEFRIDSNFTNGTDQRQVVAIADNAFDDCNISVINIDDSVDAPDITSDTFANVRNPWYHVIIKKADPLYSKYVNIIGKQHIYVK